MTEQINEGCRKCGTEDSGRFNRDEDVCDDCLVGVKALLIPVEGPVREYDLAPGLDALQEAVDGLVEAMPLPEFIDPDGAATAYVNEEGKFTQQPNMRATDFMVPGVGIGFGDYVAGPLLLVGFDPNTGEHRDVPVKAVQRVRLIEREAA